MKTCESYTCKIWIAGDYADACRIVRQFCEAGACFAVQPADYVYTMGQESGVCVTRINYPRFPATPKDILDQCKELAQALIAGLHQGSYTIETPYEMHFFSRRGEE